LADFDEYNCANKKPILKNAYGQQQVPSRLDSISGRTTIGFASSKDDSVKYQPSIENSNVIITANSNANSTGSKKPGKVDGYEILVKKLEAIFFLN
jgi:hypothetical protein